VADATDLAIADFAEHLVPEAFTTASTAHRVELLPLPARESAFAEWIERCRQDAVAARYPFGGAPAGVVYVRRGDERWRWDQERCGQLEWLTGRINHEVAAFPDPWVFVTSLEGRDRAAEPAEDGTVAEDLRWTQPWYAEARGCGVARVLTGIAELHGSAVVGRCPLPDRTGFERAARRVLARHPSRRRHRLR
jgi:hypothetical protein